MRHFVLLLCALALWAVIATGCSTQSPPQAEQPLENLLAYKDGNYDEVKVNRYRSLLTQLDATYDDDQRSIAEKTLKAQSLLKDEGVSESVLNLLEGMNKLFGVSRDDQSYTDCLATYMAMRKKGMSHTDAVTGLKDILHTFMSGG